MNLGNFGHGRPLRLPSLFGFCFPRPVVAVAVWFFGKTIHDLYEKIQAALARSPPASRKILPALRVVRAYAQEEAEIRGFDEPNASMSRAKTSNSSAPGACQCLRSGAHGTTFLIRVVAGAAISFSAADFSGARLIAFNGYPLYSSGP